MEIPFQKENVIQILCSTNIISLGNRWNHFRCDLNWTLRSHLSDTVSRTNKGGMSGLVSTMWLSAHKTIWYEKHVARICSMDCASTHNNYYNVYTRDRRGLAALSSARLYCGKTISYILTPGDAWRPVLRLVCCRVAAAAAAVRRWNVYLLLGARSLSLSHF